MAETAGTAWGWREWLLLATMWAVMMVGMMLPSAAPMILLFSRVGDTRSGHRRQATSVAYFAFGYLAVWWGFSLLAALIQWQLHAIGLLSPDMRAVSPIAGAAVLIGAGIYQWLPLKQSCLHRCRTPFGFLTGYWREGRLGAVAMGVIHGAFCLGCCWLLMALLFVAGVMNLVWVAVIAAVVLLEKVFPAGPSLARAGGIILIGFGIAVLFG